MWKGQQIMYHKTLIRKLSSYDIGEIFLCTLQLTVMGYINVTNTLFIIIITIMSKKKIPKGTMIHLAIYSLLMSPISETIFPVIS